ncbi:transposase, partial [Spongiibacter sp.]|uniref:transposase n=1 Tax=Spongiibacter sp. TaxID=2024860 RepID=UPI0035641E49
MANTHSKERVIEYAVGFEVEVVELTEKQGVKANQIAEVLGLHPVMVYRWRQEYREGKFVLSTPQLVSTPQ